MMRNEKSNVIRRKIAGGRKKDPRCAEEVRWKLGKDMERGGRRCSVFGVRCSGKRRIPVVLPFLECLSTVVLECLAPAV
jgi:hypothetical protein